MNINTGTDQRARSAQYDRQKEKLYQIYFIPPLTNLPPYAILKVHYAE